MHVGLRVEDLDESIDFYTKLLGCGPTLVRPGYAKWLLDDPRVNFTIDTHGEGPPGSAHYGIQAESEQELADLRGQIDAARLPRADQDGEVCCYHLQHKSWVTDPDGVLWEAFFTEAAHDDYGTTQLPNLPEASRLDAECCEEIAARPEKE